MSLIDDDILEGEPLERVLLPKTNLVRGDENLEF